MQSGLKDPLLFFRDMENLRSIIKNHLSEGIVLMDLMHNSSSDFVKVIIDSSKNIPIKETSKIAKRIKNDDKINSLKPFLTSPSEFQPIASELEILYLIENKKIKTAKIKLDKLLKQNNISNNQRNRLSTIDEIYFK